MAASEGIDPAAWLDDQLAGASPDLLRTMVKTFAEAVMSAEADQRCGADYGTRSPERVNSRNGYRTRDWDTRVGSIELAIPCEGAVGGTVVGEDALDNDSAFAEPGDRPPQDGGRGCGPLVGVDLGVGDA